MQIFGITDKRWKTAAEITDQPRTLKHKVQDFNNHFGEDAEHNMYIISGSWGYKLTNDREEIMASIDKEEALAKRRFKQMSRRRKRAEDFFSQNERLPL